jgi:hypothetical protein
MLTLSRVIHRDWVCHFVAIVVRLARGAGFKCARFSVYPS